VALDGAGNLYVTDLGNARIRKVRLPITLAAPSVNGLVPVQADVSATGLLASTTYYFYPIGTNGAGTVTGAVQSFTTSAAALSSVTIASGNSHPAWARSGDVIMVAIVTDSAIATPAVSIGGQSAAVSGYGTHWNASVTVPAGATQGPISFSVALQGPGGVIRTTATDGSSVSIDTLPPALSNPGAQVAHAPDAGGVAVNYSSPVAVDSGSGLASLTYSIPSGSIFPPGATRVTATATDLVGNQSAVQFNVLVQNDSVPTPTALAVWQQLYFASFSGAGAPGASPAGDGIPNLVKFALNLDPTLPTSIPWSLSESPGNLVYTYTRSTAAVNDGTVFFVEWSDLLNPNQWSTSGVTQTIISGDSTVQTVQAAIATPANARGRFVRLRITHP